MVNEIIDILNETLGGLHSSQVMYGIAQSMERVQGTEREILPCLVDTVGEGKYVGIDDVKSIIGYHKLNVASSTQVNNGKGDNPGDLINTYSLSMILYWDRKRFNQVADDLLMLIQSRWPILIVGAPDTKVVRVRLVNANFNSLQIYAQEYALENSKLPPQMSMAQFNYTIEITFNPACIKACP
jgi:hypothetical protein